MYTPICQTKDTENGFWHSHHTIFLIGCSLLSNFAPRSPFVIIFHSISCVFEAKSSVTSRDLLLVCFFFHILCNFGNWLFFDFLCSDFCRFSSLHCRFPTGIYVYKFVLIFERGMASKFWTFCGIFVADETELSCVYCVRRTRNYLHYSFFVGALLVIVVRDFPLCVKTMSLPPVRRNLFAFPHRLAGFYIFRCFRFICVICRGKSVLEGQPSLSFHRCVPISASFCFVSSPHHLSFVFPPSSSTYLCLTPPVSCHLPSTSVAPAVRLPPPLFFA